MLLVHCYCRTTSGNIFEKSLPSTNASGEDHLKMLPSVGTATPRSGEYILVPRRPLENYDLITPHPWSGYIRNLSLTLSREIFSYHTPTGGVLSVIPPLCPPSFRVLYTNNTLKLGEPNGVMTYNTPHVRGWYEKSPETKSREIYHKSRSQVWSYAYLGICFLLRWAKKIGVRIF